MHRSWVHQPLWKLRPRDAIAATDIAKNEPPRDLTCVVRGLLHSPPARDLAFPLDQAKLWNNAPKTPIDSQYGRIEIENAAYQDG